MSIRTGAVRVLHLDDSPLDAELIRERLVADDAGAWDFVHVEGRGAFERAVAAASYDLILTDYSIPGYDGLAAIELAHRAHPETPVIVISGTLSEEEAVAALRAGATDYIFKQRLQRLAPAARRALSEAAERRRRREAEASVKQLSEGFSQLAANSADIFWMRSVRTGEFVFVSPSVTRVWEAGPEAFHANPRTWMEAIHPDERERVRRAFETWIAGTAPRFDEEYRVVRRDGSVSWIQDGGTRLADSTGASEYVSGVARDVTEKREAHRQIVESEKRFRATFEQAAVGITFIDFAGRRLRVNQRYCEIVGYSADELMSGARATHPEDAAASRLRRDELARGAASTNRALKRYVRKDGRVVWCDVTNSLVRNADDKPVYILTVIQDATERVNAQQKLAETEELLRSSISSMAEGFLVADTQGRILATNPNAGRILGFPTQELVGRRVTDPAFVAIREDGTPYTLAERPFSKALATGEPQVDAVMGMRRATGEIAWVCLNATPLLTPDRSGIRGVVLTFHDITEVRRAQQEIGELNASLERKVQDRTLALASETAKLRAVLDTAADAIITIDERGTMLSCNRAAEKMLGYPTSDIVGVNVSRIMPEADARLHDGGLNRYLRSGDSGIIGTSGREVPVRRRDGSVFPARLSISEGMDGDRRFFTGILHDITELKRREQQVLRLNADLEQRAAQAEAANRELEAFSYSVSHDLRAPLNAIGGFAEALSDSCSERLDQRGHHFLQRIRAGAERMDALIDDLLSLARISRADLVASDVDLAPLASEIMAEIAEGQPGRKSRLSVASDLRAFADRGLMRVVFANLLGNAWKFSGNREQTVIEVGRLPREGASDVFYVKDNGAGFDKGYASRLFTAFQRLHGQSEFPGSGIGLATVRRVIERHGGEVWAESVEGEGATFYFSLPKSPASIANLDGQRPS
jgi:PAS domain S-box-containing protein